MINTVGVRDCTTHRHSDVFDNTRDGHAISERFTQNLITPTRFLKQCLLYVLTFIFQRKKLINEIIYFSKRNKNDGKE